MRSRDAMKYRGEPTKHRCEAMMDTLQPDFTELLFALTQERSSPRVLDLITSHLAALDGVALARIWLIDGGDICPTCPTRRDCPDQTRCLHLVSSAGSSQTESGTDWSRTKGDFRRIPIGVRKVGLIAQSGRSMEIPDVLDDMHHIARPDWARAEGIRGFGGHPLVFQGETLGVLAIFFRVLMVEDGFPQQRVLASHAAASIANARAFEEIDRLRTELELENSYLREEVLEATSFGSIVGRSPAVEAVLQKIALVGPTDATVMVLGESGTGKELIAREIHRASDRCHKPLVRVNCATIPRELYESEFFGHAKGAFTGAVKDRAGRFEAADGGTLFLDEIGEMPLDLQSKLLRVLQEGQYERVGEERTREVDVRIIAATNRDLKAEVEAGRFREDLYYRLNVFPLEIAPLRERRSDVPLLANHFLELAAQKMKVAKPRLTQARALELQRYDWPGNVRELQNVIERAVITARGGRLRFDMLDLSPVAPSLDASAGDGEVTVLTDAEVRRIEHDNFVAALEAAKGKIYGPGGAADLLEMKATTFASRLKKHGIAWRG